MNDVELIKWREEKDLPQIQKLIDEHVKELVGDEGSGWTLDYARLWHLGAMLSEIGAELEECQERMKQQEGKPELAGYLILNKKYFLEQYEIYKKYWREIHDIVERIAKEIGVEPMPKKENGSVTHEQIDRAREYPVEKLLDFRKNYARCLWHDDKNPSMRLKNNTVNCFVCNRGGDAIAVYRRLHGVTFQEAVRALC